jgi:hypothetical protein
MEERRRKSRRLQGVPVTEAELLWRISEGIATLTERLDNHLDSHKEAEKDKVKSQDLRWMKIGIVAAICSPFLAHFAMLIGK